MTTKRSQCLLIQVRIYATTNYVSEKTFLWSLKISSLFGILSTEYSPVMECSKQTHKQTNKPFCQIPGRKTCWDTIFCAQGANDRPYTLKITGAINQKGSVRNSSLWYNLCSKFFWQSRVVLYLFGQENPNVSVSRMAGKTDHKSTEANSNANGLKSIFPLCRHFQIHQASTKIKY